MTIAAQIKAKREALTEILDEAQAIVDLQSDENRDLTSDEQARLDAILGVGDEPGEADSIKSEIARLEKLEKRIGEISATRDPHGVRATVVTDRTLDPAADKWKIHATARRANRLKAFAGDNVNGDGLRAEERAYRFGMLGLHILGGSLPTMYHFPKADEFVRRNIRGAAHDAGSPTFADYGIPEEFSTDLIRLVEARGAVRRLFDVVPMASDTKRVTKEVSGMTTYAVAESAAGTESNAVYGEVVLIANKFMTLGRMSSEIEEDHVIDFGDRLATAIAYSQADKEDECGFNGDGGAGFGGIEGIVHLLQDIDGGGTDSAGLNIGSGNSWSALTLQDFYDTVALLQPWGDTNETAWACHRAFYYTVMQPLEMAQGGATARELATGDRAPRPLFLGYPVEFVGVLPNATAVTQVACTLGDYSVACMFGDRRSFTLSFSTDAVIGGESTFERDQIAVKATERYDIQCHDLGNTAGTVAGSVVGLQTSTV